MARVAKPRAKLRPTFLRAWRKYRGLTQEEAGEALNLDRTQLGRVERAIQPYSQTLLEAAADLYDCTPADLLRVDPLHQDPADEWDRLMKGATAEQRAEVIGYARGRLDS